MHQVERTWSPYDRLSGRARDRLKRLWRRVGLSDEFATLARYELDMLLLRIRCTLGPSYRHQVRELSRRRHLKVHLGCGNNLKPGWLNLDCYPPPTVPGIETLVLDMRRGLPLANGSVDAIYSEHFLEHVPLEIVRETLLPELHRILAPGGEIRIGVPDGEFYVRGYMALHGDQRDPYYKSLLGDELPMMWINDVARSSAHKYLYDYETLERLLGDAGFAQLRRGVANDSSSPVFAGQDMTGEGREEVTVYAEGRRS
jgi:predicted SAM-dependent methyltransferase